MRGEGCVARMEWGVEGLLRRYIFAAGGRNGVWEEGAGKEVLTVPTPTVVCLSRR